MSNQDEDPKFDVAKYTTTGVNTTRAGGLDWGGTTNSYVDLSDSYANNLKTYVSFHHVSSGRAVYFKAFIDNLTETYNCDWTRESIFGRSDPVPIFKQNERIIDLNLKIPAGTLGEAYENLGNVQQLIQFMYPQYEQDYTAENGENYYHDSFTITKPPLVRLKVMNLIRSTAGTALTSEGEPSDGGAFTDSNQLLYDEYTSDPSSERGLLGIIRNCTVLHNLESEEGVFEKSENTILPKLIEVAITFGVIHEQSIGYMPPLTYTHPDGGGEFVMPPEDMHMFPYGVSLVHDTNFELDSEYGRSQQTDEESEGATAEIEESEYMGLTQTLKKNLGFK